MFFFENSAIEMERGNQVERCLVSGLVRGAKRALSRAVRRGGVGVYHCHELAVFVAFGAALIHKILDTSLPTSNDADSSVEVIFRT